MQSAILNMQESELAVKNRIKIFLSNGNLKRIIRHPISAFGIFVLKVLEYAYSR